MREEGILSGVQRLAMSNSCLGSIDRGQDSDEDSGLDEKDFQTELVLDAQSMLEEQKAAIDRDSLVTASVVRPDDSPIFECTWGMAMASKWSLR